MAPDFSNQRRRYWYLNKNLFREEGGGIVMRWVKWVVAGLLAAALCALMPLSAEAKETLRVFDGMEVVEMTWEEYLVCVVAGEMPAEYEEEALKAQAVAARTRAVRGRCLSHSDADVCTDSRCCQAFLTEEEQDARWGEDAALYRARILEAVRETGSLILTYDGEPIEVLYHAVSGGQTEDVEAVYPNALPYLRSVPSPGEEDASRFETVQTFDDEALAAIFPDEAADGVVALEVLDRSDSGRVLTIRVGAHTMSGRLFRSALGLSSTNFEIEREDGTVTISQRGYGHGVGMSQAGANAMAKSGATFADILFHYYTGVAISVRTE